MLCSWDAEEYGLVGSTEWAEEHAGDRAARESADRAADAALASGDSAAMRPVNDVLLQRESAFLDAKGLPNRPWFRHMLIAPGLTTGYAPWPFPALQQAVEERDAALAASEVKRVVAAIRSVLRS